nr:PRC-barrel domain-containing protein [Micavibrio sp.]
KMGSSTFMLDSTTMNLAPSGNGYKTGFTKEQVSDMLPQLLSAIATASGDDGLLSLTHLKGAQVWTASGRKIGKIEDVLFDQLGGKAELLFINMGNSILSDDQIAIPFAAATYTHDGRVIKATIPDVMAKAMKEFKK